MFMLKLAERLCQQFQNRQVNAWEVFEQNVKKKKNIYSPEDAYSAQNCGVL